MTFSASIREIENGYIAQTSWYEEERFFDSFEKALAYLRRVWKSYDKEMKEDC